MASYDYLPAAVLASILLAVAGLLNRWKDVATPVSSWTKTQAHHGKFPRHTHRIALGNLYGVGKTIRMGWDFNFSMMRYGEKMAKGSLYRRLFHQHFRREAIPAYHPVQLNKIHGLLRGLLSTPEDFTLRVHRQNYVKGL
ncbi:hypothetical protein B0H14DRAFT_2579134 [Mycena olivaceomarginata]|nr:hypothetical protein B0H14DRAFT_2579134 [Mycena olivaceomarginata]